MKDRAMNMRLRLIISLSVGLAAASAWAGAWSTNFVCFRGGSYDGWGECVTTNSIGLGGGVLTLSSGADQSFAWSDAEADLAAFTITVVESGVPPAVTNGGALRISVPSGWQCRFSPAVTAPAFGGSAAGKVNSSVSYSGNGDSLIVTAVSAFDEGDILTIDGLKLLDMALCSPGPRRFELEFTGDGQRDAYDQCLTSITVSWPGGFYDGWDSCMPDDPMHFWKPRGVLIMSQ